MRYPLSKHDPDGIFLGDNGRTYCGKHLGASADMTGRDLSGQRVERIGPEGARAMDDDLAAYGLHVACEECGQRPSH